VLTSVEPTSKVGPSHLERDAYVYVRQSTLAQVHDNTESLERQYELATKAQALGWAPQQVVIVDDDLGRSGADSTARAGFKGLVADVGLGKVGAVLGIEVSRLARNNTDWYQLLDLCALTDTLIVDGDGIYHPGHYNDRLLLGLKGTMSEAELHLIRGRLTAGLKHKAAKGELRQGLPVGLVYNDDDQVELDPDEAVREAIATVFRRFDEMGSARQVLLSLLEDNVALPRRPSGSRRVTWAPASYPAVHHILTNPAYAGAFVFGRCRSEKRLDEKGQLVVRSKKVPRGDWEVLVVGHHQGYISWERYERLQDQLRANWRPRRGESGGAVREGTALLQGRIRCGRCGRPMQTGYSGANGDCPRYTCSRAKAMYGAERTCQSLGGKKLEARVMEEVFAVLEPAAIAATVKALAEVEANYQSRIGVFQLSAERARYEADRARRQFDAVEPENRLVARTLEAAWEEALKKARQCEAELAAQKARRPARLDEEEVSWLQRAGADLRAVFYAPSTTWRQRKQLLRALVAEVVVTVRAAEREADVTLTWEGGARTSFVLPMNKPGLHSRVTDEATVDLVRRLAARYDDKTVAQVLSRQGRRTATGLSFSQRRVQHLRVANGIPAHTPPLTVTPDEENGEVLSITAAEKKLGVSRATLYRWVADGFITGEQLTPEGPWHIRVTDELRSRIVPEVPEGWLGLDQAAKALGVARQTVLHKVQRGELEAVHVNRGKRKGLRINVKAPGVGLFETGN
jgi:DNA invertase Pin-like site-specific DNA recombinase